MSSKVGAVNLAVTGGIRQEVYLNPGVPETPGQHNKTPSQKRKGLERWLCDYEHWMFFQRT